MCKLNEKFKEWEKWYSEDDNSVCAQISNMLLEAAVYHSINEAKKYVATDNNGEPELNWLVHNFIDRGFLVTQTLFIRRLCDKRNDVVSLRRLVKDMENNRSLLERKNILSAFEFPYDYQKAIDEGHQTNNSKMVLNGAHSGNIHKNIDLLAGVKPKQRQPNDVIQNGVFDRLNKYLDKCQPIVDLANKAIAHTATQQSKKTVPPENLKTSLARIHKAHCLTVRVAAFVGQIILYKSSGLNQLPSCPGKFEHLDKPLVKQEDFKKLENLWERYEKHINHFSEHPDKLLRNNP